MHRNCVVLLACLLAVPAAHGQYVEDSIDVGAGWVASLAYNSRADVIYGCCEEAGRFFTIDCATNTLVSWLPATGALCVAYDATDNKAYCSISFQGPDSILVVDGLTHTRLKTISMPSAAMLVWDSVGDRLYVSCDVEECIGVIDCRNDSVMCLIPSPGGPLGMDINTLHRKLYVRNWDGQTLSIIDMQTNQVITTIPLGGIPESGCYMASVDKYYCSAGSGVAVINGTRDTAAAFVDLPSGDELVAMAGIETHGLVMVASYTGGVDTVFVVDADVDTLRSAIPIGWRVPQSLLYSGRTDLVYCANYRNSVTVLMGDASGAPFDIPASTAPYSLGYSVARRAVYVGHSNSRWVYVIKDSVTGVSETGVAGDVPAAAMSVTPNPFRDRLQILMPCGSKELPICVYSRIGVLVRVLEPSEGGPRAGRYTWDGRDAQGRVLPNGVYLLRTADGRSTAAVKIQ